jgi:hypothetical protein
VSLTRIFAVVLSVFLLAVPRSIAYATDDIVFTTTRLNNPGSVIIKVGQAIGFDISGLIIPIFNDEEQIATPNHEPLAKWKDAFNRLFTPQNYKDDGKHIDWDANAEPVFYTGLYGAILRADADHSNHPLPTDCYISEKFEKSSDIPFAPLDFQKAREVDAWLGVDPVDPDPTTGVINWTLPSKTIGGMNPNEDCKKHELGFEMKPLENNLRQLAQFGSGTLIEGHEIVSLFTTVVKWIDGIRTEETEYDKEAKKNLVILTMKKMIPWYHTKTHDGGGPGNEAGPFSGNSPISGGWTAFTLREEDKKEMEDASLQPYEISVGGFPQKPMETSYDLIRQAAVRTEQARCYALPDTSQSSAGNVQNSWFIGGVPPEEPQCEPIPQCGEPPVFKGAASCNQCSPNMAGWAEPGTVPGNKLPDNLIKMVEEVGQAFGVPPASILAAMYHEGAFVSTQLDASLYQSGPFTGGDSWTNENVIKWSTCGQTMPNCPLEQNTFAKCNIGGSGGEQCGKAIVGTGVIPKWFWGNGGDSDIWNAVLEIDSTRTKETISPCNLLDSVAALGKALKIWGLYPRTPAQCYGRSMTSASAGSCSPSSWSEDKIVQSHVGLWVGSLAFCPDGSMSPPPEFGENSTDPGYADNKVLAPYKAFSCK